MWSHIHWSPLPSINVLGYSPLYLVGTMVGLCDQRNLAEVISMSLLKIAHTKAWLLLTFLKHLLWGKPGDRKVLNPSRSQVNEWAIFEMTLAALVKLSRWCNPGWQFHYNLKPDPSWAVPGFLTQKLWVIIQVLSC